MRSPPISSSHGQFYVSRTQRQDYRIWFSTIKKLLISLRSCCWTVCFLLHKPNMQFWDCFSRIALFCTLQLIRLVIVQAHAKLYWVVYNWNTTEMSILCNFSTLVLHSHKEHDKWELHSDLSDRDNFDLKEENRNEEINKHYFYYGNYQQHDALLMPYYRLYIWMLALKLAVAVCTTWYNPSGAIFNCIKY